MPEEFIAVFFLSIADFAAEDYISSLIIKNGSGDTFCIVVVIVSRGGRPSSWAF